MMYLELGGDQFNLLTCGRKWTPFNLHGFRMFRPFEEEKKSSWA